MAKEPSLYPTALDTEFLTDRISGDTITSSAYDILESAVSAIEVKLGVDFSGTNTISASKLSGASVYATTVTATNVSATSLSSTNVYATTVTATNICATTFSGTNLTINGTPKFNFGTEIGAGYSYSYSSFAGFSPYVGAGNGVWNALANSYVIIDDDNDTTSASFIVAKDARLPENNPTTIFEVFESGTTSLSGGSGTLSSANVYATTVTATNITASTICANALCARDLSAMGSPAQIAFVVDGYTANKFSIVANAGAAGPMDILSRGYLNFRVGGSGGDNFRMTYDTTNEYFEGMRDSKPLKLGKVALASDIAAIPFYVYGQDAYASATVNLNGGHTYIRGGNKAGAGVAGNVYLASDGTNAVGAIVASGNLSAGNVYATTVTATTVSANVYQGLGYLTSTAVTDTSVTMSANNTYVANNAGIVSATLPTSAGVGAVIEIVGYGAGMWRIIQQAGQTIHFGNLDSTTGATGYLSATLAHDCVRLMCVATSTDYVVVGSMGNIVVV